MPNSFDVFVEVLKKIMTEVLESYSGKYLKKKEVSKIVESIINNTLETKIDDLPDKEPEETNVVPKETRSEKGNYVAITASPDEENKKPDKMGVIMSWPNGQPNPDGTKDDTEPYEL